MRITTCRTTKKRTARVFLGVQRGARARLTIVMIGRDLAFDAAEDLRQ
jgi:hypothetical protein